MIQIIKNRKFINKYDQNYLLMIFKSSNFTSGVITLAELMQLREELLSIYINHQNYDKIMSICNNYAGNDSSFWIQALHCFINSSLPNKYDYIDNIFDRVIETGILSPILVLDILKSGESNLKDSKKFLLKLLKKEYKIINENKEEYEKNDQKITQFGEELSEMTTKFSQFTMVKCSICNQATTNINVVPIVFYMCHHAFHMYCLNAELKDEDCKGEQKCPTCGNRSYQVINRIKQSEEKKENYNEFKMALNTQTNRFDYVSKVFGSGVFKMS